MLEAEPVLLAAEARINPWPQGLEPGSLAPLVSPDDREPDCHLWLCERIGQLPEHDTRAIGPAQDLVRTEFTLRYSWSIPTCEALETIDRLSPAGVLEVGAGNGYWSYLLRSRGVPVLAIDRFPVEKGTNPAWKSDRSAEAKSLIKPWTAVEEWNGKEIAAFGPEPTLLICWLYSVQTVRTYQGSTIVFVGEPRGRNELHEFYDELASHWTVAGRVALPRFFNSHDSFWIFRRRSAPGTQPKRPIPA